jgi:Flp pilus assembly protein TadD
MRAEELVRAEPHRADLHRKLGFLLAKQGRSEDAATEFRRAVECGRRRVQ